MTFAYVRSLDFCDPSCEMSLDSEEYTLMESTFGEDFEKVKTIPIDKLAKLETRY